MRSLGSSRGSRHHHHRLIRQSGTMCGGVLKTSDDKRIFFAESDDNFRAYGRENERVLCDLCFQMSNGILFSPIRFRSNIMPPPVPLIRPAFGAPESQIAMMRHNRPAFGATKKYNVHCTPTTESTIARSRPVPKRALRQSGFSELVEFDVSRVVPTTASTRCFVDPLASIVVRRRNQLQRNVIKCRCVERIAFRWVFRFEVAVAPVCQWLTKTVPPPPIGLHGVRRRARICAL